MTREFFIITVAGLLVFLNLKVNLVSAHGRLIKPPGRSSIWRVAAYKHLDPPQNYNDNQLYCGGVHQRDIPGTSCGVCGDPVHEGRPRSNEVGGRFYKGIITEVYESGDVIYVEAEVTAPHSGFMEWRLCTDPLWQEQECFDKHLLQIGDGSGSRLQVGQQAGVFWAKLKLPDGVVCDHCVIQWNYRAGNNWGFCQDGGGRLGCGPQETFRGCSDVRIVPRTSPLPSTSKKKYSIKNSPSPSNSIVR